MQQAIEKPSKTLMEFFAAGLAVVVFLCAAFFTIGPGLWESFFLLTSGRVTQATITDWKEVRGRKGGPVYYMRYKYSIKDSTHTPHTFFGSLSKSQTFYQTHPIGDTLTITYAADNPRISQVGTHIIGRVILLLVGGVFWGIVIWFFTRFTWKKGQYAHLSTRLAHEGITASGVVMNMWKERKHSSWEYYVMYQYLHHFQVKQQVSFSQYHGLKKGDSITIRYLPHEPSQSRIVSHI